VSGISGRATPILLLDSVLERCKFRAYFLQLLFRSGLLLRIGR